MRWATGRARSIRARLAVYYKVMGQYEKAIMLCEQSEVIFEDFIDLYNLMFSVRGLGECLTLLGNYAQAMALEVLCVIKSINLRQR
jgi:tetratricopeptide (TPR) repeat protein